MCSHVARVCVAAEWAAIKHELGHNVGMNHASTDPNNDGVIDAEYGDDSCPYVLSVGKACGARVD